MKLVANAIHRARRVDWGHVAAVVGTALVLLALMVLVGTAPPLFGLSL